MLEALLTLGLVSSIVFIGVYGTQRAIVAVVKETWITNTCVDICLCHSTYRTGTGRAIGATIRVARLAFVSVLLTGLTFGG